MTKPLLAGKRGLIMGVANDRSIAWGIARQMAEHGAELAFTYQGEVLERRVKPLVESIGASVMIPCDVTDDAAMDAAFAALKERWGTIDFVIHAIAFSDKDELEGRYVSTSRANFLRSMDISVYSFTAVAQRAAPLMSAGGSMLTLSYFGAEKVISNYNVMGVAKAALECSVRYLAADLGRDGIRVNAISAGPIKTLAAAGISGMRTMLKLNELHAPLRRNVTTDEVGGAAVFLSSDLAAGITGEITYVDGGYNIMGMMTIDQIDATITALSANRAVG